MLPANNLLSTSSIKSPQPFPTELPGPLARVDRRCTCTRTGHLRLEIDIVVARS